MNPLFPQAPTVTTRPRSRMSIPLPLRFILAYFGLALAILAVEQITFLEPVSAILVGIFALAAMACSWAAVITLVRAVWRWFRA